jgi:hypothetical protein
LDIPGGGDVRNGAADFSGLRAQEAPEIERDQMTVLIYVDTSKQVGDPTTSRCSPTRRLRKAGLRKAILKVSLSNIR